MLKRVSLLTINTVWMTTNNLLIWNVALPQKERNEYSYTQACPRASEEPTYAGMRWENEDRNLYFTYICCQCTQGCCSYVILYLILYAGHHFIRHLPGKDCTQNHWTSFVVTWLLKMASWRQIPIGKHFYTKQYSLDGRCKRAVIPTCDQIHLGWRWWSQYWRKDLSIEWQQPCCRQNHSICLSSDLSSAKYLGQQLNDHL